MEKIKALVLVCGEFHDFARGGDALVEFLKATGEIEVTMTEERSVLESTSLNSYDLCIFYTQGGKLTDEQLTGLLNFVRSGKGFVGIHCASDSFKENEEYIEMLGGMFIDHGPRHEFTVNIEDKEHPITKGISDFRIADELYVDKHDPTKLHILMTAQWAGKAEPMAWTKTYRKGKVFYLALGHDLEAILNENFQRLVIQGVHWVTAKWQ